MAARSELELDLRASPGPPPPRTFPTLSAARAWRSEAQVAVRRGALRLGSQVTLRQAADAWLRGAKAGTIRSRSGHPYKPSVLRTYEAHLKNRLLPELGGRRLSQISRRELQDYSERLLQEGLSASSVRNILMPLRAIYRRAIYRSEV